MSVPTTTTRGFAVRSATYVFGSRMAVQVLSLVRGIIVARLLVPSDLGAFFLIAAVVGALEIAGNPGLEDALIDSVDERQRLWASVWTLLVMRGALLTGVLLVLADPIASWLNSPEVVGLLRLAALVPFFRGLTSLSLTWARRRVDLRPSAKSDLLAAMVETAVGIALAAATGSAWALVFAMVAGTAARAVWSFRYRGFAPRLVLSWGEVRPLFGFSKWRSVSNLLYYMSVRADDLLVGRYLGHGPLGSYRIAYRLANLPTTEIVYVVERVAFPALAQRARNAPRMAVDLHRQTLLLTSGLAGPLAAVCAAVAQPTVATLLGSAYSDAAAPLAIMCLAGYLRAIVSTAASLMLSLGRPELDALISSARAIVLVVGIVTLTRHGIVGAAVASLLSLIVTIPPWLWALAQVGVSPINALTTVGGRLPAAAAAGGAAWALSQLAPGQLASMMAGIAAGLVVFVATIAFFDQPLRRDLLSLGRRFRSPAVPL